MTSAIKRNPLLPWYIGLAIVIAAVSFVGYRMFTGNCQAPLMVELIVLLVIPVIYMALMYLTFISQD